ncbi:type 2 lanthipeptide synthetase LanM family protein [Streptomyces sp. NPDC048057]|uniref:type 2 lanthipeptide synthetase LanM family protein n=1 Tax=Streptomyces sp. NPDC048057 TaxID=3155628 RepID=UPI0034004D4C
MAAVRRTTLARADKAAYSHERTPVSGGSPDDPSGVLTAWRESAFMSEETFQLRLSRAGTTARDFARRIAADSFVPAPQAVAWEAELLAVLSAPAGRPLPPLHTRQFGHDFKRQPFEPLLARFLTHFDGRLQQVLTAGPPLVRDLAGRLRGQLLGSLANRLLRISVRTLILELNVARVEQRLDGATPEERYDAYCRGPLRDPAYLRQLFEEYPVLGRSMVECAEQWVTHIAEVLNRLVEDETELRAAGLTNSPVATLRDVRLDLGDAHNEGRSVTLVTFDDGTRLIYKPRSVATEALYSRVVEAVNGHGASFGNLPMRVLERRDHGWCEFIEHGPCASSDEVPEFYWRIGGTLANLLFLGAIDFHLENVIAAGARPVPIDMETFFQHPPYEDDATTAHQKSVHMLFESVLATGMLPARVFGDHRREGVDLSGINGGMPQESSRPVPTIVDAYRDTMRIEGRYVTLEKAANRPFTEDGDIRPEDHLEEIVSGFTETYDILVKHHDEFRALLDAAAGTEIRHLARQTRRYGLFLTESYHPDYLRDALDRERLLDKLWATAETRPDLVPVIELEKRQLLRGDIPCFRTRPSSTALHAPACGEAPEYFGRASLSVLQERFAGFGREHRDLQEKIIRETMSTLVTDARAVPAGPLVEGAPDSTPEAARAAAHRLLSRLADQAVMGRDDCGWIGVSIDGGREDALTYKPLGTALYDGMSGMALTFGYAAALFDDDRYLDLARRSAVPLIEQLRDSRENGLRPSPGAFDGIGGVLYALDHLESLTGDAGYAEEIAAAAPLFRRTVEEEDSPDVVGGLAGCAVVAATLYRRHGLEEYRQVAEVCAQRLLERSIDVAGSAAWKPAAQSEPLGGFSHGSAGIAWALFELASFLQAPELRTLAWKAVEFDRRLFVPAEGRWRDLRHEQGIVSSKVLRNAGWWCNGGVGVGISRLLIARGEEEPELSDEARAALAAAYDRGFGENQSLCHGDFGNLELFTLASQVFPDPAEAAHWRQIRDRVAGAATARIDRAGVRSGVPGHAVDVPALMIGSAGVCMGLMRLAAPERVPGPLWLEAPVPDGPRSAPRTV